MQSYALSESHYVDAIQGISTIKVNNKEDFFDSLNKRSYSNFQKRIFDLGILHNQFNFLTEILATVFIIAVFAVASFMVLQKSLLIGEMIAISRSPQGLYPPSTGWCSPISKYRKLGSHLIECMNLLQPSPKATLKKDLIFLIQGLLI